MKTKRKFLLTDKAILRTLQDAGVTFRKVNVTWFYTSFSPEIYYLQQDENFTLHHKKEDLVRKALSFKILKDDFLGAKSDMQCSSVSKTRYGFANSQAEFWLEIFGGKLATLVILQANFKSEEASEKFDFIKTFGEQDYREITDDYRYKMRYLARFGVPSAQMDYTFATEVFKASPQLRFQIPAYADSANVAQVILNQIYFQILKSHSEYLRSADSEALHRFRIAMRKARALLKFCTPLCDERIASELLSELKNIVNKTNQMRDIEIFDKFLHSKSAPANFISHVNALKSKADERTKAVLGASEFESFKAKFGEFLQNFTSTYTHGEYEKICKCFVANRLSKGLKSLRLAISGLDEKSEISKFHDTRIELKKLRYTLEYFARMYDDGGVKGAYKQIKALQISFGALQDVSIWQNFIAMYKRASDKNSEIFAYLLELNNELVVQTNSIKKEILQGKDEINKSIKKSISKIKAYR